jgi:hypothetical protein
VSCPSCELIKELEERVKALEEELVTEHQFRLQAEWDRDRALEDLCALQDAKKEWS